MPGPVLRGFGLIKSSTVDAVPILPKKKLRPREVKLLAWGHSAGSGRTWV